MTHTTSGGAYYRTAIELRGFARTARKSYPEALERARDTGQGPLAHEARIHASVLAAQIIGFELAAALYCVAQAVEDAYPQARPVHDPREPL